MTAVLLVRPSTMASEPSALDKYKNESSLLVDLNFNDLTAGQTGTYQSGNIVASINGQTAGTGEDGTTAANLSSGFWMSLTSADGSAVLQGKHAITISYDSKPASSGNSGWTLYAARDAAKPTYGYEHYIGFLTKPTRSHSNATTTPRAVARSQCQRCFQCRLEARGCSRIRRIHHNVRQRHTCEQRGGQRKP